METLKQINERKIMILIGGKKRGTSTLQKPIRSIVVLSKNKVDESEIESLQKKIEGWINGESS